MKRCTVCRGKIYRGMEDHIRMHQMAARRKHGRPSVIHAPAMESAELVGVGTEVVIPQNAKSGFWSRIGQWFREVLRTVGMARGNNPSFM